MRLKVDANSARLITSVFALFTLSVIGLGQHQGHQVPQSSSPTPTATPSPSPSGTHTYRQTPVTKVPSDSPVQEQEMNTPMPATSPSPSVEKHDMDSMHKGPLVVMTRDGMGIRVGSSETNVISMGASGSGTAWQPSSGPVYMHHWTKGDWLLMFHYHFIAEVNRQDGPRGVTKFDSANWFMAMAYHKVGNGTLQLRGMFSAEPFTIPPGGSPLLFQTGETYKGRPLIDHQHPHDLFMELSAQYTLPIGERGTWFTYFGYPGEPALGPVSVPHRTSASENPSATLAHHLQDPRTTVLACSRQALLIGGSNWKDRSLMDVSLTRIDITSMLINGILDLRGFGSCQTTIGRSKSVMGFCAVLRTRNLTVIFAEQLPQCSTTNASIVETGRRLLFGDGIISASGARFAI